MFTSIIHLCAQLDYFFNRVRVPQALRADGGGPIIGGQDWRLEAIH